MFSYLPFGEGCWYNEIKDQQNKAVDAIRAGTEPTAHGSGTMWEWMRSAGWGMWQRKTFSLVCSLVSIGSWNPEVFLSLSCWMFKEMPPAPKDLRGLNTNLQEHAWPMVGSQSHSLLAQAKWLALIKNCPFQTNKQTKTVHFRTRSRKHKLP